MPGGRDEGVHPGAAGGGGEGSALLIQQKWQALPAEQRLSLKNYVVDRILEFGSADNLSKSMHNILSKCNSILVQIVKY